MADQQPVDARRVRFHVPPRFMTRREFQRCRRNLTFEQCVSYAIPGNKNWWKLKWVSGCHSMVSSFNSDDAVCYGKLFSFFSLTRYTINIRTLVSNKTMLVWTTRAIVVCPMKDFFLWPSVPAILQYPYHSEGTYGYIFEGSYLGRILLFFDV